MKTRVVRVDPARPDPSVIVPAAEVLQGGGLVAFPTETVYGLAGLAFSVSAVERLFAAKARPFNRPVAILIASLEDISKVAPDLTDKAARLARQFMPGPLTLVVRASTAIPKTVTAGSDKVGIRIPNHPVALALLRAVETPLVVSSANCHQQPAPTRAQGVLAQLDGQIELLLDGGTCSLGVESTVVDVACDPPVILRQGPVTKAEIEHVIGRTVLRV
jgi:L-threonylcarbamoyladenylate synthase